jgi:hypothetical protein
LKSYREGTPRKQEEIWEIDAVNEVNEVNFVPDNLLD